GMVALGARHAATRRALAAGRPRGGSALVVPGRAVLVVCAAAALLFAGCKPSVPEVATAAEEVPSVPGTTYEVKLAHCPTSLQVSLPTGFLRERSAEISRKKAVCQPV